MRMFVRAMALGLLTGLAGSSLAGCTHPISPALRQNAVSELDFPLLHANPEKFKGQTVVLGGMIVKTRNSPEGAEIEVVQKALGYGGRPAADDATGGRFLFVKEGFLEPEIYANGRYVTGAGKVTGYKAGKVDEREYNFPVVAAQELHLWETQNPWPYYYHPYPFYLGDPFYRSSYNNGVFFNRYSLGYPYYWR